MKPLSLFINPNTRLLRGGWRAAIFLILFSLPNEIGSLIVRSGPESTPQPPSVSVGAIFFYCLMIGWAIFVSWLCLRLIEQLPLAALGCSPHRGWGYHLLFGVVISVLMISAVVLFEGIGGLRLGPNAMLSWSAMGNEIVASLVIFIFAAAYEELLFRGYPLQTLTTGGATMQSSASLHFRHNRRATIGWADGHVSAELFEWTYPVNVYGARNAKYLLGFFGPRENRSFARD
jgi:prepilin-type processing-associated H-X9-DG protein